MKKYQQIQLLADQGMSVAQIAEQMRLSTDTVRQHRRYKPMYRSQEQTQLRYRAMVDDYLAEVPTKDILAKYNVTKETLYNARKRFGVPSHRSKK